MLLAAALVALHGGIGLPSTTNRRRRTRPDHPRLQRPLYTPVSVRAGVGEAVDTELDKRLGARVAAEPDMFGSESDADDIFAATPQDVKEKEAAAQVGLVWMAAAWVASKDCATLPQQLSMPGGSIGCVQ